MKFFIACYFLVAGLSFAASNSVFKTIDSRQIENLPYEIHEEFRGKDSVLVEGQTFKVLRRSTAIQRYPCSHCHDQMRQTVNAKPTKAHWNVKMLHPNFSNTCNLCHGGDKSLVTLEGDSVGFDHSYKVCAQCHGMQYKDWVGGAHGKRAVGWKAQRVILNCTECHNPHDPEFKKRKPATFATYPQ